MSKKKPKAITDDLDRTSRLHLRFGWWSLLAFLALGLVLEALHGLKIDAYLSVASSTRRLMWTLAHAHGTLFALLHLALSWTVTQTPSWTPSARRWASRSLLSGSVLLPAGFLLGGAKTHGGDPGIVVFLVALGGLLLAIAVLLTALAVSREGSGKRSSN